MGMVAPEQRIAQCVRGRMGSARYHRAGKDLGNESPANLP